MVPAETALQISIHLLGPVAMALLTFFSITARWIIQGNAMNTGSDLAFCAVGLRLDLMFRRIERLSVEGQMENLIHAGGVADLGMDVVLFVFLLLSWIVCIGLIQKTKYGKKLLARIDYSTIATFLGLITLGVEMYLRFYH